MPKKLTHSEEQNWAGRIGAAQKVHEEHVKKWKKVIDLYANRRVPPVEGMAVDQDQVTVNIIFSNVRVKVPYLYFQNPDFMVLSRREMDPDRIRLVDSTLRWALRHTKIKRTMNRCVTDSLLMSMGVSKLGYTVRTQSNVEVPPREDTGGILESLKKLLPKMRASSKETSAITPPPRILSEGPIAMRVSPAAFMTHPDATFPLDEGARWCSQIAVKTLNEVLHDNRYDLSWRKKLKATHFYDASGVKLTSNDSMKPTDLDMAFVVLYEVWDRVHREVLSFAEGNWDNGAGRIRDWPFKKMEGYPFKLLVPFELPDEWEALTELDPIAHQVEELNKIRTYQILHLKRANRKYVASPDLDEADLRALEIGSDGLVVRSSERGDVRGMLAPVQDGTISPDVYNTQEVVKEDINIIGAVAQYDRGSVAGANTATEATIIEGGNRARADFAQDQVSEFFLENLEGLLAICKQFLPDDLVVRATGDSLRAWEKVTRDDLDGDFDLEVISGSSAPPNRELLRVQAMNLYERWVNDPGIDQYELKKLLARQFPDLLSGGLAEKLIKNTNTAVPALPPSMAARLGGGNGMGAPPPEMMPPEMGPIPGGPQPAAPVPMGVG